MGELQPDMMQKALDRAMERVVQEKIDTLLTKNKKKIQANWEKKKNETITIDTKLSAPESVKI